MKPRILLNSSTPRKCGWIYCVILFSTVVNQVWSDEPFQKTIHPFLAANCVKCHSQPDKEGRVKSGPKGDVDLGMLRTEKDLLGNADVIGQLIDVLDSYDMPPDTEPEIPDAEREKVIGLLKQALKNSAQQETIRRSRVRRLNRFQYNFTVRDLFGLDRDVFALPEKLMTRHSPYLQKPSARMPEQVQVASYSLNPKPGLRNVMAFPKDLRAAHGFDNQSNQLTMSPLLLDAFLRLAVSIVESPDFNQQTVGVWQELFEEPQDSKELKKETRTRIARFLNKAFRRKVENELIDRYARFALGKIETGVGYTEAMKKVASAALSSPMFLYRIESNDRRDRQFELASNLSYLLWASAPDEELLRLAAEGKLSETKVLLAVVQRMLTDPKIERFLDSFPAQWLQLDNVLAATPDPRKQRLFSLEKDHPASLQMLVEPLLLFDAMFVEDRPLVDLIQPDFGYQSDFLKTWYTSDLSPPKVDRSKILQQNQFNDQRRVMLVQKLQAAQTQVDRLVQPIRKQLLTEKQKGEETKTVDLKPVAAWEFAGDLKASIGKLDLVSHGKVRFKNGSVELNQSHLLSPPLPFDLNAKTLEVRFVPHNLEQRGGGVMGIQGQGDFFDTIVLGERQPRHWISGSNGFSRTLDFPGSSPEQKQNELIHLVMVYEADGTTLLYRNGQPYGKPFNKGRAVFPKERSQVLFGLRHLPAGGNKFLHVSLDQARLYDRALTPAEVKAAHLGKHHFVSEQELVAAMTKDQQNQLTALTTQISDAQKDLESVPPNRDPNRVVQEVRDRFDNEMRQKMKDQIFRRVKTDDPRYGGLITNAAVMSMTSGPKRSHPIARGAWIIEVIFNDPPPPPPNDIPPLNEDSGDQNLTIREKFRVHRANPDCAGCHSRLDPLGFAMENFDLTGRWRDKYENGRDVDMKGKLMKRYAFNNVVEFKQAIVGEEPRLATAFTEHLLRFALARELLPRDRLTVEQILEEAQSSRYSIKKILKEVILSDPFLNLK